MLGLIALCLGCFILWGFINGVGLMSAFGLIGIGRSIYIISIQDLNPVPDF